MAYREVTMIEITEVLRQWRGAAQAGRAPARARPENRAALPADGRRCGLAPSIDAVALSDEQVTAILMALRSGSERPYGASWQQCVAQRDFIAERPRQDPASRRSAGCSPARGGDPVGDALPLRDGGPPLWPPRANHPGGRRRPGEEGME